MSPFLQFIQEMLPALSQILAVYGFGIAFFLFISQTETYNRVAWFSKMDGDNHAWLAIFNTSRRYLVKDHIYHDFLTIKAANAVAESKKEFVMSKQLLRSGTSIGANVKEAIRGQSKADFGAKMNIALKEASESEYWIELLYETDFINAIESESMLADCRELLKLLTSIVKTTFTNKDN